MRPPNAPRSLRAVQRPTLVPRSQRRGIRAAIIGGGITGLTAASQLLKAPACTNVTIFEKSPKLGGWLQSERVPVNGGDVLFEYGPRTLRSGFPKAVPLLSLVLNRN